MLIRRTLMGLLAAVAAVGLGAGIVVIATILSDARPGRLPTATPVRPLPQRAIGTPPGSGPLLFTPTAAPPRAPDTATPTPVATRPPPATPDPPATPTPTVSLVRLSPTTTTAPSLPPGAPPRTATPGPARGRRPLATAMPRPATPAVTVTVTPTSTGTPTSTPR